MQHLGRLYLTMFRNLVLIQQANSVWQKLLCELLDANDPVLTQDEQKLFHFLIHLLQSVMVSVISDLVNNQCTHASGACLQCLSFSEQ